MLCVQLRMGAQAAMLAMAVSRDFWTSAMRMLALVGSFLRMA